jgi:hypothetical protein
MSAVNNIEVAQKACAFVGITPITSFTQNTTEAIILNGVYDEIVEAELAGYPWRFAMAQRELDRLAATPAAQWSAAYQIPEDILLVRNVKENDSIIEYDRYDDNIYCDAGANSTVVLDGIYRAAEVDWPAYFRLGIEYRLAAALASGVTMKADLASLYDEKAEIQIKKAKNIDSGAQTSRKLKMTRLVDIRG